MTEVFGSKLDFVNKYPFLVEISENCFVGYYGGKFKIRLALPAFPEMDRMSVSLFEGLQILDIRKITKNEYLQGFMEDLLAFLDCHKQKCATQAIPDVTALLGILNQLELIKREHLCNVFTDNMMEKIKIAGFKLHENHHLEMVRSSGTEFQVTSHSLPDLGASVELFKWHASPEAHTSSFVQILNQLEEFYSNLHTLDELCHVVDPPEIDTRTTWRIIKFSRKVFLKITLHPLQPSSIVVAFIGPTIEIEYLRELYNGKLEDWDPESDVYTNLLRIFEIMSFPMRSEHGGEENDADNCGICMSYRDDNSKIPIISCDNEKCSLIFHISCLKQWFLSLKESKTFFSISIGTCPYCKQKVSSSFDELLNNLR